MPSQSAFQASRLKTDRAKRHIDELNREISAFLAREPYSVMVEPDPEPRHCSYVFRVREDPPKTLAPIIGDAIHNLRTALDLAACDAVRAAGESVKEVYFPFAKCADELEGQIAKRKIGRAGPAIVELVRQLKPYKGGNETLRAIHDLDVIDKHISIIPTGHFAGFSTKIFRSGVTMADFHDVLIGPLSDGQHAMTLPMQPNHEVGTEVDSVFVIAFGEGQVLEGEPVLQWLETAQNLVASIIDEFENRCRCAGA